MKTKTALPDKPSELIRVALKDLKSVEKSPFYKVDMLRWHKGLTLSRRCTVCLAGAVMARTLKMPILKDITPYTHEFDDGLTNKLGALDSFRQGYIARALHRMGIGQPSELWPDFPVREYHDDKKGFHEDMQALSKILAEAGL